MKKFDIPTAIRNLRGRDHHVLPPVRIGDIVRFKETAHSYIAFFKSDRPLGEYPIGTKARAISGGYWIRVERGWKWFNGSTFPRPGGDWDGWIELPEHCR